MRRHDVQRTLCEWTHLRKKKFLTGYRMIGNVQHLVRADGRQHTPSCIRSLLCAPIISFIFSFGAMACPTECPPDGTNYFIMWGINRNGRIARRSNAAAWPLGRNDCSNIAIGANREKFGVVKFAHINVVIHHRFLRRSHALSLHWAQKNGKL